MIAQNTGAKFMSLFLRNIWYALPVLNSDTEIILKFSITEINIFYFFLEIILKRLSSFHCVKTSKYGVSSGSNTGKYGPEKTPYLDTFHRVFLMVLCNM